jgi:hypothetical protein
MANKTTFRMISPDLKKFSKKLRKLPRKVAVATGTMLNEFAFGTRDEIISNLPHMMIVRNEKFVARQIRVKKSHRRLPISTQRSETGSIFGKRFTGWTEQQLGKKSRRKKTIHITARMGNKASIAKPRFRLKPSAGFITPDDYSGGTSNDRAFRMIRSLDRKGHRKPFIITGYRKAKSGVYRFKGGRKGKRRLVMLQNFEDSPKQARRLRWLEISRDEYLRSVPMQTLWAKAFGQALR